MTQYRIGGKLPPRNSASLLKLASIVTLGTLPTPPATLDYGGKVAPWGMYGNDKLGDCTVAGAAHDIELWAALEGKRARPLLRTIESVYKKLSPQDQGCVMEDVLSFWRHTGIGGHKLFAYAALELKNHEHVKLSLSLFGGVYVGVALPLSAQDFVGPGKVWDLPAEGLHGNGKPGSWGGHCIVIVAYNDIGPVVVTWGALQQLTWAFWDAYVDEAYCLLTADWEQPPKISGIDFVALQAYLGKLKK